MNNESFSESIRELDDGLKVISETIERLRTNRINNPNTYWCDIGIRESLSYTRAIGALALSALISLNDRLEALEEKIK